MASRIHVCIHKHTCVTCVQALCDLLGKQEGKEKREREKERKEVNLDFALAARASNQGGCGLPKGSENQKEQKVAVVQGVLGGVSLCVST